MNIELKKGINLIPLKTNHTTSLKNSGVGILINIFEKSTQIFISGDTGWNYEISEAYKNQVYNDWHRILVAHVSSLNINEVISFINMKPKFYDKHLCIHGLIKCIECIIPEIVILSEIGEELAPIIDDIAKLVNTSYRVNCFVGMNQYKYNID